MVKSGEVINGYRDQILIMAEPLNKFFNDNVEYRNQLLIFASSCMDALQIIGFYRWSRFGSSWRFMITFASFYVFRVLVQSLWYIEKPPGYDWGFPGYMSIFVGYGTTTDFFYSGHVGCCVVHALEFNTVGWNIMSYFAIFAMFTQAFTMVVLRSHYTVDMIAGVIFAHYAFILVERHIYLVDYHVFGIPLEKRMATSNEDFKGEHP